MKKSSYFLAIAFVFSLAQISTAQITIGAAGNIVITNWVENYDDTKARLSFSIGGAALYDINDRFQAGAELLFGSVGPRIDDPPEKGRASIQMIQIPLFGSFEIIDGLKVHAGFQPGIILSAKIHITDGPFEGEYDLKEDFGTLDLEFILGASYDITENITAILRLNRGLVDMAKDSDESINMGVQFGARYWFWSK